MDLNNRVNLGVSGNRLGNVAAPRRRLIRPVRYQSFAHVCSWDGPVGDQPESAPSPCMLQATEANEGDDHHADSAWPGGLAILSLFRELAKAPVPPAVKVWPKTGPYSSYFRVTGATATAFTYNVLYKGLTSPVAAPIFLKELDEIQLVLDRRHGGTFRHPAASALTQTPCPTGPAAARMRRRSTPLRCPSASRSTSPFH